MSGANDTTTLPSEPPTVSGGTGLPKAVVAVATVALLVLSAIVVEAVADPAPTAAPPAVAQPAAASGDWYCPVVAGEGEPAVLSVAAAGDEPAQVTVVHYLPDGPVADAPVEVAPGGQLDVELPPEQAVRPVSVRWAGGPTVATWRVDGEQTAAGPCAAGPSSTWYLSGLATADGSRSTLHLFNPYSVDAVARVVFHTPEGRVALVRTDTVLVEAGQSLVLDVNEVQPEEADLGASVEVQTGRLVVQGQTTYAPVPGSTGPTGRTLVPAASEATASEWAFGYARTDERSVSSLSVLNPTDREAAIEVRVSDPLPTGSLLGEVSIPAGGVVRIDLAESSAQVEFGVAATGVNDVPVVVSRTVALATQDGREDVATSLGAAPAAQWAIAGGGSNERQGRLSLYNPGAELRTVDVTTGGVEPEGWRGILLAPNQRATIELAEAGADRAGIGLRIQADGPMLPELRSVAEGTPYRLWTLVGTPSSAWTGPPTRPAVQRAPSLATAPLAGPSPIPLGEDPPAASEAPSPGDLAASEGPLPEDPPVEEATPEPPPVEEATPGAPPAEEAPPEAPAPPADPAEEPATDG